MDLIQIMREIPIPHHSGSKYKGIAFDGSHYYLSCLDYCEIAKYDLNFCEVEVIKTLKAYSSICFDFKRNCFWAASAQCPNKIFKIDYCFLEIDCKSIPCCESSSGIISGLSYDCRKDALLICCTNAILSFCPETPNEYELLQKSDLTCNIAATSVAPSYLIVKSQSTKQQLCVYDSASNIRCKYEIPDDYVVEALLLSTSNMHSYKLASFYLLASKNGCKPYILEFMLPCCKISICHCNYSICHKCHKPCPPAPCPEPKQACADLMESIALIETALSHILNAEGEKLQKVIASTDDVDKILCVNKSIRETIVSITHLEIILHDKLASIKECCNICDDD